MDASEKISVIVPAYNVESYLPNCIDSLLAQTHNNIEVIVVNDGSSDNTATILNEYAAKDSRVKAIHKENGGVTSARLCGVSKATGEWIGFVDGDDTVEPTMYERLLTNAYTYQADISHCGYQLVFPDGRTDCYYDTNQLIEQDTIKGLQDLLMGEYVEPGLCNKLFKSSLFESLNQERLFDSSIKLNEDLLMNFILFKASRKSVYEGVCPYHYIVRSDSAIHQSMSEYKIYDPLKVKDIILTIAPSEIKEQALIAWLTTCVRSYMELVIHGVKERKHYLFFRTKIKENKKYISLLSSKNRIYANMIRWIPHIFNLMYYMYGQWFMNKKYG